MYYPYILKELLHRRHRTLVNILGIAVGITLFVAINALSAAYQRAAGQPFQNLGADLVVQRGEKQSMAAGQSPKSMQGIRLPFSNQLFSPRQLADMGHIEGVAASAQALLLWEFARDGFRTILGVDSSRPDLGPVKVKKWIKSGRFPQNPGEVVLEKHYAKFHKIRLGDTITVGDRKFNVVGVLEIKEGAQIAAANIYLPLAAARTLWGKNPQAANLIFVRLKDPSLLSQVRSRISARLKDVSVTSSDSFLELMGGVSMISTRFSLTASLVALAGAVLLIMKTMLSNLTERSREIGILKALGWTQGQIQQQLFGETVVQAMSGGILGLLMGYLISYFLGFFSIAIPLPWGLNPLPALARQTALATRTVRLPVSVSFELAAISMVLALVVGCVSGYLLGRRTARMKPADILRQL
jgi:putative ABC transport system permease protein